MSASVSQQQQQWWWAVSMSVVAQLHLRSRPGCCCSDMGTWRWQRRHGDAVGQISHSRTVICWKSRIIGLADSFGHSGISQYLTKTKLSVLLFYLFTLSLNTLWHVAELPVVKISYFYSQLLNFMAIKNNEIITNFLRNAAKALTNSCWFTSLTLTP